MLRPQLRFLERRGLQRQRLQPGRLALRGDAHPHAAQPFAHAACDSRYNHSCTAADFHALPDPGDAYADTTRPNGDAHTGSSHRHAHRNPYAGRPHRHADLDPYARRPYRYTHFDHHPHSQTDGEATTSY